MPSKRPLPPALLALAVVALSAAAVAGIAGSAQAQSVCDVRIQEFAKTTLSEAADSFAVVLVNDGCSMLDASEIPLSFTLRHDGCDVYAAPTHVVKGRDFGATKEARVEYAFNLNAQHNSTCAFFPHGSKPWTVTARVNFTVPSGWNEDRTNNVRESSVVLEPVFLLQNAAYSIRGDTSTGNERIVREHDSVAIEVRIENRGHKEGAVSPTLRLKPVDDQGRRLAGEVLLRALAGEDVVGGAEIDRLGSGSLLFRWAATRSVFPPGTAGVILQTTALDNATVFPDAAFTLRIRPASDAAVDSLVTPESGVVPIAETFRATVEVVKAATSTEYDVYLEEIADTVRRHVNATSSGAASDRDRLTFNFKPGSPEFHVRACANSSSGLDCSALAGPFRVASPLSGLEGIEAHERDGNLTLTVSFARSGSMSDWAGSLPFDLTVLDRGVALSRDLRDGLVTPGTAPVRLVYENVIRMRDVEYPCGRPAELTARVRVDDVFTYAAGLTLRPPTSLEAFFTPPERLVEWRPSNLELVLRPPEAGIPDNVTLAVVATWKGAEGEPETILERVIPGDHFNCSRGALTVRVPWTPVVPEGLDADGDGIPVSFSVKVDYAVGSDVRPVVVPTSTTNVVAKPHLVIGDESAIRLNSPQLLEPAAGVLLLDLQGPAATDPARMRIVDVVVRNVGHAPTVGAFTVSFTHGDRVAQGTWSDTLAPGATARFRALMPLEYGLSTVTARIDPGASGMNADARPQRNLHTLLADLRVTNAEGLDSTSSPNLLLHVNARGASDVAYKLEGRANWGPWERYTGTPIPFRWPTESDPLPSVGKRDLVILARVRATDADGVVHHVAELKGVIAYDREPPQILERDWQSRIEQRLVTSSIVVEASKPSSLSLGDDCVRAGFTKEPDRGHHASFTIRGESLQPGSYYSCTVTVTDRLGNEAPSRRLDLTTPALAPTPVHTTETVYNIVGNRVTLRWEAPRDDGGAAVVAYRVVEQTPAGSCRTVATAPGDAREIDVLVERDGASEYFKSATRRYAVVAVNDPTDRESERNACLEIHGFSLMTVEVHPQVMPLITLSTLLVLVAAAGVPLIRNRATHWQRRYSRRALARRQAGAGERAGRVAVHAAHRAASWWRDTKAQAESAWRRVRERGAAWRSEADNDAESPDTVEPAEVEWPRDPRGPGGWN